eukprot:EG_transcript_14994
MNRFPQSAALTTNLPGVEPGVVSSWNASPNGVIRLRHFCYSPTLEALVVFGRDPSVAKEVVRVRSEFRRTQLQVTLRHADASEFAGVPWNPQTSVIVRFSGKHDNLWHLFQIYIRYLNLLRVEGVAGAPDVLLFKETVDRPLHPAIFGSRRVLLSKAKGSPPRCYAKGLLGLTSGFDPEDVWRFVRLAQAHFHVVPPATPRCPPVVLMAERPFTRKLLNWQDVVAKVRTQLPGLEVRSVRWHTMSLADQVRLSSSGVAGLVGVHGQNLVWTVFMRGGVLVQLCPPNCFLCQPAVRELCFEPLAHAQNVTPVRLYPRFSLRSYNHTPLFACDRVMYLPRRDIDQIAQACRAALTPLAERCHAGRSAVTR